MNSISIVIIALVYLLLLFTIAYWAEKRANTKKSVVRNPYVYALTLAVYCTAWTYYGSVGNASTSGISFLAIYVGPLITIPLWPTVLRKTILISKRQRTTSLSDFLSSRYGKSTQLGGLIAILSLIGIIPYISLQLKAITDSFSIISNTNDVQTFFGDKAFYIALILIVFIILFGTRYVETNIRREGMVATIAFESLFKLIAFVTAGLFITYGLFNGFGDIFKQASQQPQLQNLFVFQQNTGYSNWMALSLISAFSFFLLPRQFQMAVVEADSDSHIQKAMWLFPIYLLLINLFVLPIAFAGKLTLPLVDPDSFVLKLTQISHSNFVSVFTYLGGFSAATSMIIVSTIALSTMVSNNLVLPQMLKTKSLKEGSKYNQQKLLNSRRIAIILIVLGSYFYYKYFTSNASLISIGIASFIAMSQFAPAFFGGLYWKGATQKGAVAGILSGFTLWFYLMITPNLVEVGLLSREFLLDGPLNIQLLSPLYFGGIQGFDHVTLTVFWTLFFNTTAFVLVSISTQPTLLESKQAALFVDIFKYEAMGVEPSSWTGTASLPDIKTLLMRFLGKNRTEEVLDRYARRNNIDWSANPQVDSRMLSFAEKLLSGAIGTSSARILLSSIVKAEEIGITEVFDILKESQQNIEINKELKQKSEQLKKATDELQEANLKLQEMASIKDEFLYTVTHELRTPLTSIRAMSEILNDSPDMEAEQRELFVKNIVVETERLSRLISNVLDLEKFESGSQDLDLDWINIKEVIQQCVSSMNSLIQEKNISIQVDITNDELSTVADYDRISQVVINLLSNALKFVKADSGKISVTAYRFDRSIKVNVSDNGPGIEPTDLVNVFDKFYQVKNQTIKKPTGNGLGLAICKNIIEMHKGKIWVENNPNGGAKFSFTLPYRSYRTLKP